MIIGIIGITVFGAGMWNLGRITGEMIERNRWHLKPRGLGLVWERKE